MATTLGNIWNLFVMCVNWVFEGIVWIVKIYFYLFFTAFVTLLCLFFMFLLARIVFMIIGVIL